MNVGIDIDGVLTNISEYMIKYGEKFLKENNINSKIDCTKYGIEEMLGIDEKTGLKFWIDYLANYIINTKPRKDAVKIVSKLKEKHTIFIITARNEYGLGDDLYGKMESLTIDWLKRNHIIYDKILFTGEYKVDACRDNKIDIIIEDSPQNIKELSEVTKVLCFDNPYNKEVKGNNITRIYSWEEAFEEINKL